MAFCSRCGTQLTDGVQFCSGCGAPVGEPVDVTTRIQKFSGEIKKCPSCGAVLPSGVLKCPECGYEIRDAQASRAALDFFNSIRTAQTIQQRADIIKNYPIPNTREDILEFLNKAKSEVENDYNPDNPAEVLLHNAWVTHFNNLKNRVNNMSANDKEEFQRIIDNTQITERHSTKDVDALRIALAKAPDQKSKINLIKTYPIKPNSENLLSLVTFIDSQVEYKNPLLEILKTLGLALLYIYTLGIAYLIIRKKRKENGTEDFSKQINNAWFVRLREIQNQSASLVEKNQEAKAKIEKAIKSIKRRKLINSLVYFIVILSLIVVFVFGKIIGPSISVSKDMNNQSSVIEEIKEK